MYLSVDRINENTAVCEDDKGNIIEIELAILPKGIKESDVIKFKDGKYYIAEEETKKRKEENIRIQDDIINRI